MTMREPRRTDGFMVRSGPAELILHILQCCHSTRDLVALVATCRHVYDVYRGNAAAALWPVWLREIPHFQDAVMAGSAIITSHCHSPHWPDWVLTPPESDARPGCCHQQASRLASFNKTASGQLSRN
jgi:hypothetical protein